jgi:hypothetical protein
MKGLVETAMELDENLQAIVMSVEERRQKSKRKLLF